MPKNKKPPKRYLKSIKTLRMFQKFVVFILVVFAVVVFSIPVLQPQEISVEQISAEDSDDYYPSIARPKAIPTKSTDVEIPEVTARAYYAFDPESNIRLIEKNPHLQLMPASTTKIATAMVALETYDLDTRVTITEEERTIGNTMKLRRGEVLTVADLLAGLLISSGNDAGLALAMSYPETGYPGFVAAMNQQVKNLGLENTNFRNVSGVESFDHYSSAYDLAYLSKTALKNPVFKQLVSQEEMSITSIGDNPVTHQLTTTNQLLGKVEGLSGVKTGWTENAGECLVTFIEREDKQIILVVLGSQDRFGETEMLVEWMYQNFDWIQPEEI